jgi:hypothetical protein
MVRKHLRKSLFFIIKLKFVYLVISLEILSYVSHLKRDYTMATKHDGNKRTLQKNTVDNCRNNACSESVMGLNISSNSNKTNHQIPLIFLWNTDNVNKSVICGKLNCHITSDNINIIHSAAIVFNMQSISTMANIPKVKLSTQIWVLLLLNPPDRFQPNLFFPNGLINWTSTYSIDTSVSDIAIPYGKYHVMSHLGIRESSLPIGTTIGSDLLSYKRQIVAWFVLQC